MFTATFYFLGVAGFILAASVCLSMGKRVGRHVEVDLIDLRAASVSLLTAGKKPTWDEIRALWMQWYARCHEKAIQKQKAIFSWARTLAMCAMLCIIGVLLEVKFDEPLTTDRIVAGFAPPRMTMAAFRASCRAPLNASAATLPVHASPSAGSDQPRSSTH